MTPVERLHAAISKLERLREVSTKGEWDAYTVPGTRREAGYVAVGIGESELRVARYEGGFFDADLIVTLHRTIDAQLAILRRGINVITDWQDEGSTFGYDPSIDPEYPKFMDSTYLALADSILGDPS